MYGVVNNISLTKAEATVRVKVTVTEMGECKTWYDLLGAVSGSIRVMCHFQHLSPLCLNYLWASTPTGFKWTHRP